MESLSIYKKKESLEKQTINALELTKDQENSLMQKIEKNNGTIRVFVHPYYNHPNMTYGWTGKYEPEKRDKMQEVMERFIANQDENQSPLFIFEEFKKMDDLKNKLKNKLGRDIYTVPTQPNTSTPSTDVSYPDDWQIEASLSWEKLRTKFRKWNVKKITIGGQSLAVDFNSEIDGSNPYEIAGCVGSAIDYLEDDFEIEVSKFSYPTDRKQYSHYRNFEDKYYKNDESND